MSDFVKGKTYIPPSGQVISDEDVEALSNTVLSRWYTDGKRCAEFRRNLAKVCQKPYPVLTNSGSSATLVALSTFAERCDPSKRLVVTCACGFPTTVAPIYQVGKIPLYIDIDPETLTPDMNELGYVLEQYGDDVCGAILAHTLGFPFHEYLASKFLQGKWLISDCCDALGAELVYGNHLYPVGHFSDAMTLSFFPAHQITSGEGGCVLFDRQELSTIADSYVNWGRDCYCAPGQTNTCGKRFENQYESLPEGWDHKYVFSRLGYNLKMGEFEAALGNSQLSRLDEFVEARNHNYEYLLYELSDLIEDERIKTVKIENGKPSPFGFPIYDFGNAFCEENAASVLIQFLEEERKIGTRRVFGGNLTKQPGFMNLPYLQGSTLKGCDDVMNNMFWIGVQPSLTKEMLDWMVESIYDFYEPL